MPTNCYQNAHWAKAREQYANELTAVILHLAMLAGPTATRATIKDFRDGGKR